MRWLAIGLALVVGCASPAMAIEEPRDTIGVLVIAHGGNEKWNATVKKTVREADLEMPTEVAFGMGMHDGEVEALQQAVNRLERRGIYRLVVIPLFASSYSEVFRQYEYLFGLREQAEWPEVEALDLEVPVTLGKALDDNPVVAEVVLERAKKLSRREDEETVILVGHGPVSEEDNVRWIDHMNRLTTYIKEQGGFRDAIALTMRDDAPKDVRAQAEQTLRNEVSRRSRDGRVLVVPLLIARGGVERKIPKMLAGLSYVFKGETLLPHPKIAGWVADEVRQLSEDVVK